MCRASTQDLTLNFRCKILRIRSESRAGHYNQTTDEGVVRKNREFEAVSLSVALLGCCCCCRPPAPPADIEDTSFCNGKD